MRTIDILEGLGIFQKYRDKPNGYHLSAEHDTIYAHPTDKPLSDEDLAKVRELGWFQDEEEYEDENEEMPIYDPDESWTAFV